MLQVKACACSGIYSPTAHTRASAERYPTCHVGCDNFSNMKRYEIKMIPALKKAASVGTRASAQKSRLSAAPFTLPLQEEADGESGVLSNKTVLLAFPHLFSGPYVFFHHAMCDLYRAALD